MLWMSQSELICSTPPTITTAAEEAATTTTAAAKTATTELAAAETKETWVTAITAAAVPTTATATATTSITTRRMLATTTKLCSWKWQWPSAVHFLNVQREIRQGWSRDRKRGWVAHWPFRQVMRSKERPSFPQATQFHTLNCGSSSRRISINHLPKEDCKRVFCWVPCYAWTSKNEAVYSSTGTHTTLISVRDCSSYGRLQRTPTSQPRFWSRSPRWPKIMNSLRTMFKDWGHQDGPSATHISQQPDSTEDWLCWLTISRTVGRSESLIRVGNRSRGRRYPGLHFSKVSAAG